MQTPSRAPDRLRLALFLLLVLGGGLTIGYLTAPGAWYAALNKPVFNPPNWVFGPVWTVLYVLIAITGWRAWRSGDRTLSNFWWAQLVLNFLWSPAFFTLQQVGVALVVILALLAAILVFLASAWRLDRLSAWMFMPYAAWVAFATALNAAILILN